MYAVLYASAAALLASRAYAGPGQAKVVNGCPYSVDLDAVPAANGGFSDIQKTLAPGESWSQTYTQLTNTMGWSIKLSHSGSKGIMQYEYTWNNDGTIWYDLSGVDGNPWNANWLLSAVGGYADQNKKSACKPNQTYYRCDTDNSYGEQSCTDDASITVTLCTAQSNDQTILDEMKSLAAQASASPPPCSWSAPPIGSIGGVLTSAVAAAVTNNAPATTTAAPPTTTAAPPTTTHTTSPAAAATTKAESKAETTSAHQQGGGNTHHQNQAEAPQPTTLLTKSTALTTALVVPTNGGPVEIVTETFVETAVAYTTVQPQARHIHHPHHGH